jgi:shikimate kinase
MPVINRTPYRNLILTGTVGVGKTGVGRLVAQRREDAKFVDVEIEIQQREGQTPRQIQEMYGIARLRTIEKNLIDELTLYRSTIIAISGRTLVESESVERLRETGPILCLTASLGEVLRRLHLTYGNWFHELDNRALMLGTIQRDQAVTTLGLPTLNTTTLGIEEAAQQAHDFWLEHADI